MDRIFLFAVTTVLLGGCLAAPVEPADPPERTVLPDWQFSDCIGFDTGVDYPLNSGPGDVPPGWEFQAFDGGRIGSYVLMAFMQCHRFSGLELERGPIAFIFESHSKFTPPDPCTQGQIARMAVLNRVYVSDEEVAEALAERGLPVEAAAIRVEADNSSARIQRWTWETPGGESHLQTQGSQGDNPYEPYVERLAWWNGTSLGVLDMTWTETLPSIPIPLVFGQLAPGMLYSGSEDTPYARTGDMHVAYEATGNLTSYGDPLCGTRL